MIAPLIGPALDRVQHGRRAALAMSFLLRTALAVVLIMNYDGATGSYPSWVLYPCALGMMVFSKSFSVLRSAVTPRVMPPTIDLVRVNSRLTVFGLIGGTIVGGGIAAGVEYVFTTLFELPGRCSWSCSSHWPGPRCRCGYRAGWRSPRVRCPRR